MVTLTRSPAEARLSMRSTLLIGGIGIAVGTALALVHTLTFGAYAMSPESLLNSLLAIRPFLPYASTLILCAALLVLAFGMPGESGIAGRGVVARVAMTALALQLLLSRIDGLVLPSLSESQVLSLTWYFTGSYLLGVVAALVAAVAVQRAGVLGGIALAATLVVVLLSIGLPLVLTVWMGVVGLDQAQALGDAWTLMGLMVAFAQIALGVVYAFEGFRMRPPRP